MGGKDGKLIHDAINWLKEQGKNKITKEELDNFLNNKKIEINNKFKKELYMEINSAMLEKKYF